KSEGVEKIDDFRPERMIKSPRIVFSPAKELREKTLQGLSFENGGVLEGGINYASLVDYRKAKGLPAPGGGTTADGEGENPLG
ncbi:MAG: hypothetical protein IKS70_01740, partial [Bacteroides sp.]|nr:hypothetical protein [Bacteroides sp.]